MTWATPSSLWCGAGCDGMDARMGICHGISGTHESDQVVIVASVTKAGGIGGCNPQFGTDM